MSKHETIATMKEVLESSGIDTTHARFAAMIVVQTDTGLSLMPVGLKNIDTITIMGIGGTYEGDKLQEEADKLVFHVAQATSHLLDETGAYNPDKTRMERLERDENGELVDATMRDIMAKITGNTKH